MQNDPQLDSQPINGEKISNSDEENQAQGGVQVLFPNIWNHYFTLGIV